MKISCQSCQAKYTIADEKVLGKIVKIRCKKCGATIVINGNEGGAQTSTSTSGAEAQAFDYAAGAGGGEQWTVNVADGDQRTMTQEEILGAYRSGVVTDDTYLWKDGMADWLPVRDVPDLYALATRGGAGGSPDTTQQEEPRPPAFPAPRAPQTDELPTQVGYSGYNAAAAAATSANGNGTANGLFGSSPPPAAARRQGGRGGGGADLFGGVAQAGGEDDVMTSAPAGMPQASHDPGKLTGQRNENSVLFSLTALTQNAPKDESPAAAGTEGSGLIDIRALSASMGSGETKKSTHVDDIMNLGGGGAFSAALTAPVLAPASADGGGLGLGGEPRKDNTKMMLIAIIGAGFLIALAIVLVVLLKKPAEPVALVAAPSAAPTDTSAPAPTATATASAAPTDSAGAAPTAPAPGGDNAGGSTGDHHAHHAGGGGGGGAAKAPDTTPPPFVPPATTPAPPAAGGGSKSLADMMRQSVPGGGDAPAAGGGQPSGAPFDRGAAAAALGSISVGGCKKPDGPTGSGHIKVTFAPSGTVTSAVVDQPPFAGTAVGGCVAGKFRSAHIPAFGGAPVGVGKSFIIE